MVKRDSLKRHIHRRKTSLDMQWSYCITPHECAAKPERQEAHGNIIRLDRCHCGALRYAEINNQHANRGPWVNYSQQG